MDTGHIEKALLYNGCVPQALAEYPHLPHGMRETGNNLPATIVDSGQMSR